MSLVTKPNEDQLSMIFREGLKTHLNNKYRQILVEAKEKLEKEYLDTVTTGAELVKTEVIRMMQDFSAKDRYEFIVKILQDSK